MEEHPTKAARFRKQAQEARAMAAHMSVGEAKAAFLRIAEDYDKLADFSERNEPK